VRLRYVRSPKGQGVARSTGAPQRQTSTALAARNMTLTLACAIALMAASSCSTTRTGAGNALGSTSPSPSISADCIAYAQPQIAKRIVHFENVKTTDGPQTVEAYVRAPITHSGQNATPSAAPSGQFSTAGRPGLVGIVVDHQSGQNLCGSMNWADTFAAEGYLAIAPSLDESYQVPETEAAVGYLRAHGATKIVLLGASMGGTAVLITAAQLQPPVQAVISVSGPASYPPLDASVTAPKLTVPVFYSAGEDDESFAADEATMYRATAGKDKVLDIVPGSSDHGFDLIGVLMGKINAFIRAHTG
jgi:hypothetical protein